MLDRAQLRIEADAQQARAKSPLWTDTDKSDDWVDMLAQSAPPPDGEAERTHPRDDSWVEEFARRPSVTPSEPEDSEIRQRLEEISEAVAGLSQAMARMKTERRAPVGVPEWLIEAAGDPRTYDAPNKDRMTVCLRVLPETKDQMELVQRRRRLRTMAGAWEYLLRLGIAAEMRLP